MTSNWMPIILFGWMLLTAGFFTLTLIGIICYWISSNRLVRQIQTSEPELLADLAHPPTHYNFFGIIKTAPVNSLKFIRWFYTGAQGAKLPKTTNQAKTIRRIFRIVMAGFISISACALVPLGAGLVALLITWPK